MATVTDLPTLLQFLAGPGAVLVVSFLLSYFAELWPRWATLAPKAKQLITLAASVALGLLALALGWWSMTWTPEMLQRANQVFLLVYVIGGSVLGPQVFHAMVNKSLGSRVMDVGALAQMVQLQPPSDQPVSATASVTVTKPPSS